MRKVLVTALVLTSALVLFGRMSGGGFTVGYFQTSLDAVNETFGTNFGDPSFAFGGVGFSARGEGVFKFVSGGEGYGFYAKDQKALFSGGTGYGYLGLLLKVGNLGFEGIAGIGGAGFSLMKDVETGDTLPATDISETGNLMYIVLGGVAADFGADVTFDITDNVQVFLGIRYNLWIWKRAWASPFGEEVSGFDFDPLVPQMYVLGVRFGRF